MLTAFIISTLIVLFIVALFVGPSFVDKIIGKKSGPKRWHIQNIYFTSVVFIVSLLGLLYLWFFEEVCSWQCFLIWVVSLAALNILFGTGRFISLLSALWWTKIIRRKVSKWPEGVWKRRIEHYLDGTEAYSGLTLFKEQSSESESQN